MKIVKKTPYQSGRTPMYQIVVNMNNDEYLQFSKLLKEDGEAVPTATTTTSDIAVFAKRMLPIVSRQGDRKKKTLREMLEYITNDSTDIN